MGLFNKLKEILFDEETVEIPVITKEVAKEENSKRSTKEESKKRIDIEDEVVIRKIETPKRRSDREDDIFDMPKLKEEAREERKGNLFTFPFFEDDEKELVTEKRRSKREEKPIFEEEPKRERTKQAAKQPRKESGFVNAYDYSYGKYNGDYKQNIEANREVIAKSLEIKEERKAFTPSPIISPVYGVLNENYKKEDIVTKDESRQASGKSVLDLDSVRRKAYGTLEDEIEISLNKKNEEISRYDDQTEPDVLEEDGISISDLLVDKDEPKEIAGEEEFEDEVEEVVPRMVDIESKNDMDVSIDEKGSTLEDDILAGIKQDRHIPPRKEKVKEEVAVKENSGGEEDLFDLIDSLYEGKGE